MFCYLSCRIYCWTLENIGIMHRIHNHTNYKAPVDFKKLTFILSEINSTKATLGKDALNILEIGCGVGNISIPVASLGHNVTAIDMDAANIQYIHANSSFSNLNAQTQMAEDLSVENIFDVVICSEVIEHLDDPEIVVRIIKNALRDHGICIFTVPNGYGPWEIKNNIKYKYKSIKSSIKQILLMNKKDNINIAINTSCESSLGHSPHVQRFSMSQLKDIFHRNGLKIKFITNSDFISPVFRVLRRRKIAKYDCILADILPHFMVSGWYIVVDKFNC
jgi:SAM-dependent methyltransferase